MVQIDSYHTLKLERYVTYLRDFSHHRNKNVDGPGPINEPSPIDWSSLRSCGRRSQRVERIATIPLVKTKCSKIPLKKPALPKCHHGLAFHSKIPLSTNWD
jgi:hypothetical protein